jgi:hypothetical protein
MALNVDAGAFSSWVRNVESRGDICMMVLNSEYEPQILHHHCHDRLPEGMVTFLKDSEDNLRMHLAGMKVMFTDKVSVNKPLFVLNGGKADAKT